MVIMVPSSVSSQESSASLLRERALFSHRNPVAAAPSIDSRVTRGGDTLEMLGSEAQSQASRDRDRSARGGRHVESSRRTRSRSWSRWRSRSSSRSATPLDPSSVDATANVFNVLKSRLVRKWVVQGMSKDGQSRAKSLGQISA